jgi:hypothetical protein
MKLTITIISVSLFFCSCSFSRNLSKNSEVVETVTTRNVDTTINVLNPIQPILLTGMIEDTLKFVSPYFTLITFVDQQKKKVATQLTPVRTLTIPIKVNEQVKTIKTALSKEVETKVNNEFKLGIYCLITLGVILIGYKIIKIWAE